MFRISTNDFIVDNIPVDVEDIPKSEGVEQSGCEVTVVQIEDF